MNITVTPATSFFEAVNMRDGGSWMWLTDSGTTHHITSKCDDFFKYRALSDRLWVKGFSAFVVETGCARIIMQTADGAKIPAVLRNVLHIRELSRRATKSFHRLFNLLQARQHGHCVVLDNPWDYFRHHTTNGGDVQIPMQLAYRLLWLLARIAIPSSATALAATMPYGKRLWHSRLGHFGES
jgi:hypothetical protein